MRSQRRKLHVLQLGVEVDGDRQLVVGHAYRQAGGKTPSASCTLAKRSANDAVVVACKRRNRRPLHAQAADTQCESAMWSG